MRKDTYSFISADDTHTQVHCVRWKDSQDKEPVGVLLIIHGMQEYIERYAPFAEYLVRQGWIVCGHDHIGHGESVMDHGDWGKMHTAHPSDTMVEDIFTHYKYICEEYRNLPHFIMGHSMGSYLVRKLLSVKSNELDALDGAVIMGTGTESNVSIFAGRLFVNLLIRLRGRDHVSPLVEKLMFNEGYHRFDKIDGDPTNSWLSKNQESVDEYFSNPKNTFKFTLNGYKALLDTTHYDNSQKNINRIRKDLAILFVSGADDPVGNMGEGVRQAFQKFWDAGIKDVGIELYEGDRHEILNETDRERVFEDIGTWLADHVDRREKEAKA